MKPKHFLFGTGIGLFLLLAGVWQWPDGNFHLIVCDVGQGDAILLVHGSAQILVDGGPNDKVLNCLGKHIPFWDRTIEMIVLTHPQADHMAGLLSVIKRYEVKYFVSGPEGNETAGFKELISLLAEKRIPVRNLFSGDEISVGKLRGIVVWPERNWVTEHIAPELAFSTIDKNELSDKEKSGDVDGLLTNTDDNSELALVNANSTMGKRATTDLNDFGIVLKVISGNFTALLTADVDSNMTDELLNTRFLTKVDVLKFPHHGSRTGATRQLLEDIKPRLAIISVGRSNRYGHPAPETLDLLRSLSIDYLRSDQSGDVEVISDGKIWWVF